MTCIIFIIYHYSYTKTRKGHHHESSSSLPFCHFSPDHIRRTGLTFSGNSAPRDFGGNRSCRLPWGFRFAKVIGTLFRALGLRAISAEKTVFPRFFAVSDRRAHCNDLQYGSFQIPDLKRAQGHPWMQCCRILSLVGYVSGPGTGCHSGGPSHRHGFAAANPRSSDRKPIPALFPRSSAFP